MQVAQGRGEEGRGLGGREKARGSGRGVCKRGRGLGSKWNLKDSGRGGVSLDPLGRRAPVVAST